MAGFGNNFGNGNSNNYGFPSIPPQPRIYPQVNPYDPIYVTGIDGANAFQMPPGVNRIILWDTEVDRFYIKMLDEIGRPRVVAVKDFFDHVEPEKKAPPAGVDMSAYPTSKDLEEFLSRYDTSKFLTKDDLDKALSQLTLGAQGRIVRNNELNQ